MRPEDYDAWYDTPRGRWIGKTEFALLHRLLAPEPGTRLLDVGCGTGWFTRRFAALNGLSVTGLDPNTEWLAYARRRAPQIKWLEADARKLPFEDGSFDHVVSVTALCFVEDWPRALGEIVRVARRRFVLGLLNRHSLLHWQQGRHGGTGAYRGTHWHTRNKVLKTLAELPVANIQGQTAIFLPSGSGWHTARKPCCRKRFPWADSWLLQAMFRRNKQGITPFTYPSRLTAFNTAGSGSWSGLRASCPCG